MDFVWNSFLTIFQDGRYDGKMNLRCNKGSFFSCYSSELLGNLGSVAKVVHSSLTETFCLKSSVEFLAGIDSIACFKLFRRVQNHHIALFDSLPDFGG